MEVNIRIINAQLRYYMRIDDPDSLSDKEWAERWQELIWIREQEAESQRKLFGGK